MERASNRFAMDLFVAVVVVVVVVVVFFWGGFLHKRLISFRLVPDPAFFHWSTGFAVTRLLFLLLFFYLLLFLVPFPLTSCSSASFFYSFLFIGGPRSRLGLFLSFFLFQFSCFFLTEQRPTR